MSYDSERYELTAQLGSTQSATPAQCAVARRIIADHARSGQDKAELLAMLGLDHQGASDAV